MDRFRKDLENLINQHSKENGSNTPDFLLAQYLCDCLKAFDRAVNNREHFYSRPMAEQEKEEISLKIDHLNQISVASGGNTNQYTIGKSTNLGLDDLIQDGA